MSDTAVKDTRITRAVAYLKRYMNTYDKQYEYAEYPVATYIDDVLYGLGVSLGDEYRNADGFRKFIAELKKHLEARK